LPIPTLIINFKNYREILGIKSIELAAEAERVSRGKNLEIVVCPPSPVLHSVARAVDIAVFSQKLEEGEEGKSTGALIPESILEAGCRGALLNHSESPIDLDAIGRLVSKARSLKLVSCVCAETAMEVATIARFSPDFLAVEPAELIGTGISVSKARPELVTESVEQARRAGFSGRMLCGAGIVTGDDAAKAKELGTQGVLVASSVVKAQNWGKKIEELAEALAD
jgi:triosephosphate isomerase